MPAEVRAERTVRRDRAVALAIAALLAEGDLTYENLAARTAVPLGYLRWAYPDLASTPLLAAS